MGDTDRSTIRRRLARLGGRRKPRVEIVAGDRLEEAGLPPAVCAPSPVQLEQAAERPTDSGPAVVLEKVYSLDAQHGRTRMGEILQIIPHLNSTVTGLELKEGFPVERLVFLDTETTGLAGGAGTLAFLVGAGFVRGDQFLLRQYFMRSPGEEAAMLSALVEDLSVDPVFITYNGKTFDIPLLETRALVGLRRRWKLSGFPHIDLLHLTRRMWRQTLPDCRLGTVEAHLLGVERTDEDIPGSEIPEIYKHYLETGDTTRIEQVLYHNEVDILSLLTLLVQLVSRFVQDDLSNLEEVEALALGRWYERAGEAAPAGEAFQRALQSGRSDVRAEALKRLSLHMKREKDYEQALLYWQQWSELDPADPIPRVEMAKYYEWRKRDLEQARYWAGEAMVSLTHWPPGPRRARVWEEIEHRQKRLAEKTARNS